MITINAFILTEGCAWDEKRVATLHGKATNVQGVEAVHILLEADFA